MLENLFNELYTVEEEDIYEETGKKKGKKKAKKVKKTKKEKKLSKKEKKALKKQKEMAKLKEASQYFLEKYKLDRNSTQTMYSSFYDIMSLEEFLDEMNVYDIGNAYDNKHVKKNEISSYQLTDDKYTFRIFHNKEKNILVTVQACGWRYSVYVYFNIKYFEFVKKIVFKFANSESISNPFKNQVFSTNKGEYNKVELNYKNDTKPLTATLKKIEEEELVFDKKSAVYKVLDEVENFFKEKTIKAYKKIGMPHKRGVIMYGEPGNGKSAMIRKFISETDGVAKIIIGASCKKEFNEVLGMVLEALGDKPAVIILEDMDSLLKDVDRSAFLNILDGMQILKGKFFIGTTNHLERLDPAIVNRVGRFDKTYPINNPSKSVRKLFFIAKKLHTVIGDYHYDDVEMVDKNNIVNYLTDMSKGLPMASMKEIVRLVTFALINGECKTVVDTEPMINDMFKEREKHRKSYAKNDKESIYNQAISQFTVQSNSSEECASLPMTLGDDDDDDEDEGFIAEAIADEAKDNKKKKKSKKKLRVKLSRKKVEGDK